MLSAVPCRPTALLVRLTFKESWNADNNPTTSCCEKTFRMVTKCFDTALVILAAIALREHTHTAQSSGHHHYIQCWIFHYYCHEIPLFSSGRHHVCITYLTLLCVDGLKKNVWFGFIAHVFIFEKVTFKKARKMLFFIESGLLPWPKRE